MTSRAAPSPAWLGLFAAGSFAGLVLVAFATGRHLMLPAEAGTVAQSGSVSASAAPPTATVREPGRGEMAELRAEPITGKLVEQLAPGQIAIVLGQRSGWSHIRFEREGRPVEGWTKDENLSLR
jgi:hypothetical protein